MKSKIELEDIQIIKNINIQDKSLFWYMGSIPHILLYQIITKFILTVGVALVKNLIHQLLSCLNLSAITNMDLPILFGSWEGIVILTLLLLMVVGYTIVDLNGMIILADSILHQKKKSMLQILKEAICSIKYFWHPMGLFWIIYLSLLAPLTTAFYGVSLTSQFYIPDFIFSVVKANAIYFIPYSIVTVLLAVFGFFNVYCFHFMIMRKLRINEAMKVSMRTMVAHKRNFAKRYGLFFLKSVGVALTMAIVLIVIPFIVAVHCAGNLEGKRMVYTFFTFHGLVCFSLFRGLFAPFQMLQLNRIYESYTEEDEGELIRPKPSLHIPFWLCAACVYGLFVCLSIVGGKHFDEIFKQTTRHKIIAHRAGGNMGNENTLVGLKAAIREGVYGSEIDVQRTKDDKYIVLHDDTLNRVCNVEGTPGEYTREELKQFRVVDTSSIGGKTTELATPEEMLKGSKDKITLYIELKGDSADDEMAEDIYTMAKKVNMLDQVVFISLKYDILVNLEARHPEARTGYLCYVAVGDVADLDVDELLLEDEFATSEVVSKAQSAGKKVFIWTVNSQETMFERLTDQSDGVITDEVKLAEVVAKQVKLNSDLSAILSYVIHYW